MSTHFLCPIPDASFLYNLPSVVSQPALGVESEDMGEDSLKVENVDYH